MIRNFTLIAVGAAALAACNSEPEVVGGQPDPMAGELAKAPPVELPPAIAASKKYRCKDNSLVTIDWLQGGKGANLRVGDAAALVALRLPAAVPAEGGNEAAPVSTAYVAEGGYSLEGVETTSTIKLALPGKGAQACHV